MYIKSCKEGNVVSEFDNRTTYKLQVEGIKGDVKIADEVIAVIAATAATEVEGVASLAGNIKKESVIKASIKGLTKAVSVKVEGDNVTVVVSLCLEYGYSIPEVSLAVQDRVKNTIENMTGLQVIDVNIRVAGVSFENKKQ